MKLCKMTQKVGYFLGLQKEVKDGLKPTDWLEM